jgi:uncharacterized membrane protein YccC
VQQRDINKFLEDQKRFDEERKYKQMLRQQIQEEELASQMQSSKMNKASRRILEEREMRLKQQQEGP